MTTCNCFSVSRYVSGTRLSAQTRLRWQLCTRPSPYAFPTPGPDKRHSAHEIILKFHSAEGQPTCVGQRLRTLCSALSERGGEQQVDPTSLEAATDTLETIWDLACQRDEDTLLGFFPDHALEQAGQLRFRMEHGESENSDGTGASAPQPPHTDRRPISLRDIVQQAHGMKGFTFDSFAVRHLYVTPPTRESVRRLSCMRTAPDRVVVRYAVAVAGGEQSVLTFGLQCEERLAPHYRSARVELVWQLTRVSGEAGGRPEEQEWQLERDGEGAPRPPGPHPSLPPEAVILAQLSALAAGDIGAVFSFASPANKAITGPLERFTQLLRSPRYRPLLGHRAAQQLDVASFRPGVHSAMVMIVSSNTGMPSEVEMWFMWVLSLQGEGEGGMPHAHCWMTDSVELISARQL